MQAFQAAGTGAGRRAGGKEEGNLSIWQVGSQVWAQSTPVHGCKGPGGAPKLHLSQASCWLLQEAKAEASLSEPPLVGPERGLT